MSAPVYDCAIVGGGPAGAATATHLARAGLNVALLDRSAFPRPKPCGDCISPGANPLLERLGVLDHVRQTAAVLNGWRIYAPNGDYFETRFDRTTADPLLSRAFAIARTRLDALLIEAARAAGTTILTPAHVTGITADPDLHYIRYREAGHTHELRCRFLVGADGLRSTVSRRSGLAGRPPGLRKLSLTAHARMIRDAVECGELHVIDGACLGLAPVERVGDDCEGTAADEPTLDAQPLCNVTLVIDSQRFGRAVAADATAFFHATIRSFPGVRHRLTASPPGPLLGSGPFDRPARAVVAPGVALVGDAAGYFDPFTGQGVYQALAAAERLAQHVNGAFRAGSLRQPLHAYARDHAAIVNGCRRLQRIIDRVCAHPQLMNRAVRALADAPHASEALAGVTGDVLPVRRLLSPKLVLTFLTRFIAAETKSAYDR